MRPTTPVGKQSSKPLRWIDKFVDHKRKLLTGQPSGSHSTAAVKKATRSNAVLPENEQSPRGQGARRLEA